MHSYTFPDHELLIGKIAEKIGFTHISLSSQLSPMIKFVPRANSAICDSYLTPAVKDYLDGFESGLNPNFQKTTKVEFMQSDGGLVDASNFTGLKAILSGPAGGVVGYAQTCYNPENKIPLIGFDMGGTSTDVSRYGLGKYDHVFETTTAGVTIQSPQLDINTVAAGGGSCLFYKNGLFVVGPESASSHPGPACYRKGGPLTITDANLFLGRLLPEYFPKIFGENEDEGLDEDITAKKFIQLTKEINEETGQSMTPDEVAYGFINVANESMTRPIRALTEAKGYITSKHRLVTFGGAGGQHAVAIAESLDISTVLIHRYSSVLSAYGMALADVVEEVQEPSSLILNDLNKIEILNKLSKLKSKATIKLIDHGFTKEFIEFEEYLNLRYKGTESSLMVLKDDDKNDYNFKESFYDLHQREFGFTLKDRDIIVDDIRIRAIGKSPHISEKTVDEQLKIVKNSTINNDSINSKVKFIKNSYFNGKRLKTPVFRLEDFDIGNQIHGPAILADGTQTIVVSPNSIATILKTHVVINVESKSIKTNELDNTIDPILLSIFGHRFMDIAEQMGMSLQRTSVSTNVKERLDFSCALFDTKGNLVANAPHLPVHLGSMSTCIRTNADIWKNKLKPGDSIVSNHPSAGGTHLPDITVITPAFDNDKIIFYVASRAHHADIGGILPGSMPPTSKELYEEGAQIYSELLVSQGKFNEERITDLLLVQPAKYPKCSGTRCLADNLNDLRAQIAANQKGISLISSLVEDFGLNTIIKYMTAIQENAANTVRRLLATVVSQHQMPLEASDYMDDGSKIQLKIYIDPKTNEAVFDFTGTSPQCYGNINAPEAVTYSAIIYCLRCLVDEDIPLNQGCLKPIKVKIPPNSLLSPAEQRAVVGGNVMTSQRVTDVILKAFKAMADSQGCCNNLTFGYGGNDENGNYTQGFGYYETIAGGHGAGPNWDGVPGVHTNMTNTRITDAEIFERRYPIILRQFSLRPNSGGKGLHNGGDGVIRDIEFRLPVTCSILSERRVIAPHGLFGGEDGSLGVNIWKKQIQDSSGKITGFETISIGGKNSVNVLPGDRVIINTPGGGAFGSIPDDQKEEKLDEFTNYISNDQKSQHFIGAGSVSQRKIIQETN